MYIINPYCVLNTRQLKSIYFLLKCECKLFFLLSLFGSSFCPSLTRKHQLLLWTFANKSLHLSGDSPTSPPLSLSPSPGFLSSAMTPNHTLTTTSSKSPNSCKSKDQDAQNRKARFSNFTIDHLLKDSSSDSSSTRETMVVDAESRIPPSPSYHPYREG